MEKYKQWINEHYSEENSLGACKEACAAMAAAFPELKIVRGHYYDFCWGQRAHWWLVDPDGETVDPTAAQFPTRGNGFYDPWDESKPEPKGQCQWCHAYVWEDRNYCSDICEEDHLADMQASMTDSGW